MIKASNIIRAKIMLTLATIQTSTLAIKFGFAIDADLAKSIVDNPVAFDTEVPKGNIPMSLAPAISISKNYDAAKPSYLGISASADKKYINIVLTNIKPNKCDADKDKAIATLFTSRYDDANKKQILADALAAVNKLK